MLHYTCVNFNHLEFCSRLLFLVVAMLQNAAHTAVGIAMAAATFRFMHATAKTAMGRVSLLGIRGGRGETLVPPTAVAGGDEGFVSLFEFEASESSDNNNSG